MNLIRIGDDTFTLASNWQELTEERAVKLGSIIGHNSAANRLAALYLMSNAPVRLNKAFTAAYAAGAAARLVELVRLTDWLWKPQPVTVHSTIHPHVQGVTYAGKRWLLPKPNLTDVTMGEYAFADAYMRKHAQAKDMATLRQLVFTVFRPARPREEVNSLDWDGYPRERFNPELIEDRAETMPRIPAIISYAAVDYVSRGMEWIALKYAPIFSKDEKKTYPFGTNGLIQSVAESQVFGNYEQVQRTSLHQVMAWLVKRNYEQAERERAAAKATNHS